MALSWLSGNDRPADLHQPSHVRPEATLRLAVIGGWGRWREECCFMDERVGSFAYQHLKATYRATSDSSIQYKCEHAQGCRAFSPAEWGRAGVPGGGVPTGELGLYCPFPEVVNFYSLIMIRFKARWPLCTMKIVRQCLLSIKPGSLCLVACVVVACVICSRLRQPPTVLARHA